MIIGLGAVTNVHANRVDLETLTGDYVIQDGDTLFGDMLASNEWFLSTPVGEDVTVYLEDVQMYNTYSKNMVGIGCYGNTTIVLIGYNMIYGHQPGYPAILSRKATP